MKTEYNKFERINKISKTILSKHYNSGIKQKILISSNKKKEESNSSLLNRKNLKQNKLNINKKLNMIKEANENHKILKYSENKRNINNRQLISGSSKSYIIDDLTKTSNPKPQKNEYNKSLLLKKYSLQNDPKMTEKFLENIRLRQSKSTNKDASLYFQRKKQKEKELCKTNQFSEQKIKFKQKLIANINTQNNNNLENIKKSKLKLINRLNLKRSDLFNPNNNTFEDIFYFDENKPIILTKEEQVIYGNRTMKGYTKIKLLGKGGYGIVWDCQKNSEVLNNFFESYAVKQISKKNSPSHLKEDVLQIARNEINILKELNDIQKEKCDLIPIIYEANEDNNDIWFSFEKGGISLSSLTFNIKGIFEKGERIYQIQKGEFLVLLFKNIAQFKFLVKENF